MSREYYEVFLKRNSGRDGSSDRDVKVNRLRKIFKNFLNTSPNAVTVRVNSTNELMTVGMISEKDNETIFQRNILTDISSPLNIGELIFWKDTAWIIIQPTNTAVEGYNKYLALECKHTVQWVDKSSVVRESLCYLVAQTDEKIKEIFKVINNSLVKTMDKNLFILMPKISIDKGQKVLLSDTAWTVTETDFISVNGLTYVSLSESGKNQFTDSSDLNDIVDVSNTYIDIENSIKVTINDDYILNPTLYRNKKQVDCNFLYKIKDNEIINIENGVISALSVGETEIMIISELDSGIYKTVEIEVVESEQEKKEIKIIGDNTIKPGQTKDYIINYYINGEITSESFEINVNTNSLANYTLEDNIVTIAALDKNNVGNIIITVSVNDIVKEKVIELTSLWG